MIRVCHHLRTGRDGNNANLNRIYTCMPMSAKNVYLGDIFLGNTLKFTSFYIYLVIFILKFQLPMWSLS